MAYDTETAVTHGVLGPDPDPSSGYPVTSDLNVYACSFTGFKYGVRSTPQSYVFADGCTFKNCEYGIYMDCKGKMWGNGNSIMMRSSFINCGTGIKIVSLPDDRTPYVTRLYDSEFIDNITDIDVQCAGIYYFYRNYFGETVTGNTVQNRRVILKEGQNTDVITNPCRLYPLANPDGSLIIDPNAPNGTAILNSMAADLIISAEALAELTENVTVNVVDDEGAVQGSWAFAAGTEE